MIMYLIRKLDTMEVIVANADKKQFVYVIVVLDGILIVTFMKVFKIYTVGTEDIKLNSAN